MVPLLNLLVVVVLAAGVWALLATLFTPPLTSGWREGIAATLRRWPRAVGCLSLSAAALVLVWRLVRWLLWALAA